MPLMRSWSQGLEKGKMLALAALVVGGKGGSKSSGKASAKGKASDNEKAEKGAALKRLRRMDTAVAEAVSVANVRLFPSYKLAMSSVFSLDVLLWPGKGRTC